MADFDTGRRDRMREKLRYIQSSCSSLETSLKHVPDRDIDVAQLEVVLDSITGQLDAFMSHSFGPGEGEMD